jgi:hypothetical protein
VAVVRENELLGHWLLALGFTLNGQQLANSNWQLAEKSSY